MWDSFWSQEHFDQWVRLLPGLSFAFMFAWGTVACFVVPLN
jgi:hypothetical protein